MLLSREGTAGGASRQGPELHAALVAGGAVVFDEAGAVRLGLTRESLESLIGDAPDFLRLAVAHLAARGAVAEGLITTSESGAGPEADGGTDVRSPGDVTEDEIRRIRVIRARGYLGADVVSRALKARRRHSPALLVVESSSRSYVGPLLAPDRPPCVLCVQRAVAPNRKCEAVLTPSVVTSGSRRVSDSTVLELVRHAMAGRRDLVLELDGEERVLRRHHVRSFSDCPLCGTSPQDLNRTRPRLRPRPKHVRADTGTRTADPRETFEAYRHLISPLTGAVRRVRRVDMGAPDLFHVFTASHAMSDDSSSFAALMRDGRDVSGGKGSTEDQARASALGEALERFSAVARGDEIDVRGTRAEVAGAIDPSEILLFSDRQYAERDRWNRTHTRLQYVPERFQADDEIAWSRVWSLQTGEPAYLPTGLLYFSFDGPGSKYGRADSNGLAAGHTLEEAILQGFLEVVERDSIALWWYNRLRMPEVDVTTFADHYVNDVFHRYGELGRAAWVLDLTSDLGIPVFAALSARRGSVEPEVIFGFGAHLDPGVALRRCVTEMNQMLATVMRPPEERVRQLRGTFDDALAWWDEATLEDNEYLLPNRQIGPRGRRCFEYTWTDDVLDDVQTCLAVADRQKLAVYLREVTREDLGLPVVKVVVPGLRHFWRRLAPGRLYDVPVTLGRLEAPTPEDRLNPVSFFV